MRFVPCHVLSCSVWFVACCAVPCSVLFSSCRLEPCPVLFSAFSVSVVFFALFSFFFVPGHGMTRLAPNRTGHGTTRHEPNRTGHGTARDELRPQRNMRRRMCCERAVQEPRIRGENRCNVVTRVRGVKVLLVAASRVGALVSKGVQCSKRKMHRRMCERGFLKSRARRKMM